MAILWGETEEARRASRRSFEESIEDLLLKNGSLHINELMKRIGHGNVLLTEYQRVLFGIEELINDGKIVIDDDNNLHLTSLTVFDAEGFEEKSIWDIIHKEEDVQKKKEIIRKYSEINPLA